MATSSIEQVLAQFQTQTLKAKLLELPSQIQSVKEELGQARMDLEHAKEDRLQAEAILTAAISAEVDPATGKAMFSNDKARTAEFIRRKNMDTDYLIADRAYEEAQVLVENLQFKLEKLQDEFRSYRYVTDLTARELALYASDSVNGNNGHQDLSGPEPF